MTAEKPVDDTASLDKKLGRVINKQTNKQCPSAHQIVLLHEAF